MKTHVNKKEKDNLPNICNFLAIRSVKTGKKVKWSEEIDEILYS